MDKVTFGHRLRIVRKEQHLTSEKLSEICEISPVFVRQIECAMRTPSLKVFARLCVELDISADYLLGDGMEEPKKE